MKAFPSCAFEDFEGTICGDCYSGYVNIEDVTDGRIAFSACNSHARRYVFNARQQQAELSSEILALYRVLYDIEDRGKRLDPVGRLLLRRNESVPLMKRIEQLINSSAAISAQKSVTNAPPNDGIVAPSDASKRPRRCRVSRLGLPRPSQVYRRIMRHGVGRAEGLDSRDDFLNARQALSLCPKPRERVIG
jgi:hypothetical protein